MQSILALTQILAPADAGGEAVAEGGRPVPPLPEAADLVSDTVAARS
jgi:hypothetical protein